MVRATHDRTRDHRGVEVTTYVTLPVAIWGFPIGTPITELLQAFGAMLGAFGRTAGQVLGAVTETVVRIGTYARLPADSIDSISEAVVAVVTPP